ncbi:hypothetical protein [Azotobacter vinelandii]|uniref:hypothetical protein n=1 Tax=Azotobacter vinelandii TaxID=354 RepID=UPI00091F62FB|nr:hypothetical protein [Azotobacter vinelandii]SFY33693.1 hypothetical protein SAMN04244547_05170 [Azotobacter vinelandii]
MIAISGDVDAAPITLDDLAAAVEHARACGAQAIDCGPVELLAYLLECRRQLLEA